METKASNEIIKAIKALQEALQKQMPSLDSDVDSLINNNVQDKHSIESFLDTILSLHNIGVGKHLFVKLLDYYETIDTEAAMFYRNEFSKKRLNNE